MSQEKRPDHPRINLFDPVNPDLHLSQLKYHFLVRRVWIPNEEFKQFSATMFRGFIGSKLNPHSIYTVQIAQNHDNSIYDIIVGFRRDNEALNLYKHSRRFVFYNKESEIELTEPFKALLEAKGELDIHLQEKTTKPREEQQRVESKIETPRMDTPKKSKQKAMDSPKREESRSRSREKEKEHKRMQNWAGRLWGLFAPRDWTKESLTILLTDILRCAKNQIFVQYQPKADIPCFIINLKSQTLISTMLAGTRATEGVLLLLRQQEVKEHGLEQVVKQRQIKATRTTPGHMQGAFNELCKALIGFRQFNLRVVTVAPYEDHFIMVIQNRVLGILKFLRVSGWKFEAVTTCVKLPPAAIERWQRFLSKVR